MLDYTYMEGVSIYGNVSGKPAVLIGRRPTDPVTPLNQRQSSLIRLERVGAQCSGGATAAFKIENTFWFWMKYFHAASSASWVR